MRTLVSLVVAVFVAAILPGSAGAQMQQRQEATVSTGVVPTPPAPAATAPAAPFAAATIRTFTYQPVCEIRREQFTDETGWRVRDVRICY